MSATDQIERILLKFKRTHLLPPLPTAVASLMRAVENHETSAAEIEKIISSDPVLMTEVLSVAASQAWERRRPSSLRHAIMLIGSRGMRSLAISLLVRSSVTRGAMAASFDPVLFSRHSLATGLLAKAVFARKQMLQPFDSVWSADEIFAGGVLHDVGFAVLARLDPELFDRTSNLARMGGSSLDEAFETIMGVTPDCLTIAVMEGWHLPSELQAMVANYRTPWKLMDEFTALCSLNYGHALARRFGYTFSWSAEAKTMPEAEIAVGLSQAEEAAVQGWVAEQVRVLMASPVAA